jgi:hypothetical protein
VPAKEPQRSSEAAEGEERRPFLLRLPPSLLADLRAWAAQDLRSLNGHIEWLLREAVRRRRRERP